MLTSTATVVRNQHFMATGRTPVIALERFLCWVAFASGFLGSALFPVDLGPFTLFPFRVFLLTLWFLFAIRVLFLRGNIARPLKEVRFYLLFLGIWLSYAVLTLGWSQSTDDGIRHVVFLATGISVTFFATHYFQERRDARRLFWLWVGMSSVLLLIGVWEHYTGQHLQTSEYHEEMISTFADSVGANLMYQPTGVFKNPNDYATFLALSIPFALSALRYSKGKLVRFASLVAVAIAFNLIVATGSRANILAVLLELAILVLFLTNLMQKTKVIIISAACLLLAVFLFPAPILGLGSKLVEELGSITMQTGLGIGSAAVRMDLARNSLRFLSDTWGFGVGAGNAEYWMAHFARYPTLGIVNPHSWGLELLTDYGVFIFAGYLLFYLGLIRELLRVWNRARDQRMVCEALLLSLAGFSIASMSSSSVMAFAPQWLLFAFVLVFLNWSRRSKAKEFA